MLTRPSFKPHFHVEITEPDTVYLLSEEEYFALSGRLYVELAKLLNGQNTVDEIAQKLQQQTSILGVYHALLRLESQGYLSDSKLDMSVEQGAFWSSLKTDSQVAASKLKTAKVAVKGIGKVSTQEFINALQSLDIQVSDEGNLTVILTDDYLQVGLDEFNQLALQTKKPWLLVKPVGTCIWVGPFFIPGETGCWDCLAQRLRGNREVETAVARQKEINQPFPTSRGILPTSLQIGVNFAATETAKWLVQGQQKLVGKIITFDLKSLHLENHILVKRPQCNVCGDKKKKELQKPKPIVLTSQQKNFTTDGGHRCVSPEETLKKYAHHISPITGIISTLPKLASESGLIHVYGANHNSGRSANNLASLRRNLRDKSAGKGKTDIQSKVSGFCEAIERYSGVFTGDEIRISGTYKQLASVAIHPYSCLLVSNAQYQNRQTWNSQHGHFAWIPEPFDEDKEVEWTSVWSLTNQTFKYLPTAYCYYNYPLAHEHDFCQGDSNGNAAGNTLEEAILQGFMELIERDSVALWWYNCLSKPGVDLASFDEPYLQALEAYYKAQNRQIWVLDITSDLKVPTFAAICCRTDQKQEDILLGYGTHFDPKIAIIRAVTELNQMSMLVSENGEIKIDDIDMKYWIENATRANQSYLLPATDIPWKVAADYPQLWSDDIAKDVQICVDIMAENGMETLILDQTHPDIGLNVVKVIVPELRHFWPRFAPGRLYEVPVKMGWLSQPLQESELNPIPMFF
ncbi:TOMM precursor leader peptide-binding protein [Calothrix sp. UHCC 0171]|uniref:TOMM precursor leader peptide-binding protein n=1 Tax=Calothrix sp. UHCC 0171 TaxID=3110245 RepID=UPI002B207A3D|nr:TOMM precursor leader peptide-binding protein [Calothrix sp. UHCC 0171]MEA5574317.1 TOMM precursor leader peptide-binding protein [Calothrix sp. UHCC 0171]